MLAGLAVLRISHATWLRIGAHRPSGLGDQVAWDLLCWPHGSNSLCAPQYFRGTFCGCCHFWTSASTLVIIIWTVSIIPVYVQCAARTGRPWGALPGWVMVLEYGCVAIAPRLFFMRRTHSRTRRTLNSVSSAKDAEPYYCSGNLALSS